MHLRVFEMVGHHEHTAFCDRLKDSCLLDSKSINVKFCGMADAVLSWLARGLASKSMLEVAVK
jgi:hypothetical protein